MPGFLRRPTFGFRLSQDGTERYILAGWPESGVLKGVAVE